jgi:hypothetical protein
VAKRRPIESEIYPFYKACKLCDEATAVSFIVGGMTEALFVGLESDQARLLLWRSITLYIRTLEQ